MTSREPARPRYRRAVRVGFPASHSLQGLEPGRDAGWPHGRDFAAEFRVETAVLAYPGLVVDDDVRDEIARHVRDRLADCDLDRLLDRPATCEAVAEHLAVWFLRFARPPGHARLVSIAVSTGSGAHGEILLDGIRP